MSVLPLFTPKPSTKLNNNNESKTWLEWDVIRLISHIGNVFSRVLPLSISLNVVQLWSIYLNQNYNPTLQNQLLFLAFYFCWLNIIFFSCSQTQNCRVRSHCMIPYYLNPHSAHKSNVQSVQLQQYFLGVSFFPSHYNCSDPQPFFVGLLEAAIFNDLNVWSS